MPRGGGAYTLSPMAADNYSVTKLGDSEGYTTHTPGPQYVVLPNENG